MRRRDFLAAMAAVPFASRGLAESQTSLVFSAIPDQDETRLVERFSKVAAYLEKALGISVKYLPVKSYPAAVAAFTNGQVQLAWFGGFTGLQARRAVPGSQAIAQGAEDVHFRSYFIANAKTGLTPTMPFPKGIAGKTFSFGSRASTSGRVMPEYFIRQAFAGKTPEQVFSKIGFSGDHSRTIQLVQSGAFDAGAVDYSIYELEKKAGMFDAAKVPVIWVSPQFPDYQWTVRGDVDATFGAGFRQKLSEAILGIKDPTILAPFARTRFIAATNAEYAPIEEVAKATDLLN